MTSLNTSHFTPLHLAGDLDAGTVAEAHIRLLGALDEVEGSNRVVKLDFDAGDGPVSPLSLQLVVSATRTFPAAQLEVGPRAAAALAALDQSKET